MFRIYDEIAAIKAGKQIQSVACPVCGTTLKMVIFGYPTEETEEFVNKHHKYFTLGGCICYGDDRDPVYLCEECYAEFTHDLKQIRLISCPLEASGSIREDECRKYDLLENTDHYELYEERDLICNKICPVKGKRVRVETKDGSFYEGKVWGTRRVYKDTGKISYLVLSNERGKYQWDELTDIILSDISTIEPLTASMEDDKCSI